MAGRAILSVVNGKRIREQKWQSTLPRGSNATQETRGHHVGAVKTNGSHMPPSPRFAALLEVVETKSLEIVDQTTKMSGNGDDVHAPGTVLKRREAVGYSGTVQCPFREGTSKSREDIVVAMQKRKFVESSSSKSLATATTKAIEMEWRSLLMSSRRVASQEDDINLELALTCSSSNYTTGKLLQANIERPKPKSNLTINLDDFDDGPIGDRDVNAKRLKLDDSSNPSCAHQLTTKLFGTILETSSIQAAPNKSGGIETMPTAYAWLRRWLPNGGKVVKKPEGVGPPENEERRPSIAAMALMGRAVLNDYHKPCEVQKMGAITLWKT